MLYISERASHTARELTHRPTHKNLNFTTPLELSYMGYLYS